MQHAYFQGKSEFVTVQGKYFQNKFDVASAYGAIITAFNQLGKQIDEVDYKKMGECLENEGKLLIRVIPSFVNFARDSLEEEQQTEKVNGEEMHNDLNEPGDDGIMLAKERLFLAFRFFLRNFTTRIGPLCLFLDDLQWSDTYSQELSKSR